jgi:branched-chain amino acid transport system substrate-binding protein
MRGRFFLGFLGLAVIIGGFLALRPVLFGHKEDDGTPTISIGVVGPFEGPNAHIGRLIMNSVKLYFDEHSIEGLRVKLIPIDTKSNPAETVSALQASVPDPNLVALIAFYHSSTAFAGRPIIQEARLPTLIYSASNPDVTRDAPYYFRLVPTDDNQAIVLAKFAHELKARRVGILYYADEYGRGLADGFQARAKEGLGLDVVYTQSYDATTTDFRPMLTILRGRDPDVVVICGFVDKTVAILNQAAERNFRPKLLAGDGTFNEDELIRGAGDNAEGIYVAAPFVFDESNAKNRTFLESYWKAYGGPGPKRNPASWSAFAYDSAGILARGLSEGGRTRESLYKYLRAMNEPSRGYDGITGLTYFDQRGDAVGRHFRLAVVRKQQFVAVK